MIHSNTSNNTKLESLKPFTFYKFIVKDMQSNLVIAELRPNRTWPSGKLPSVKCVTTNNISAPKMMTLQGRPLSHHQIELKWDTPNPANGNLKPYAVYCIDRDGFQTAPIRTTKSILVVPFLKPSTLYECVVLASTHQELEQDPKECEVLLNSYTISTLDIGESRGFM